MRSQTDKPNFINNFSVLLENVKETQNYTKMQNMQSTYNKKLHSSNLCVCCSIGRDCLFCLLVVSFVHNFRNHLSWHLFDKNYTVFNVRNVHHKAVSLFYFYVCISNIALGYNTVLLKLNSQVKKSAKNLCKKLQANCRYFGLN